MQPIQLNGRPIRDAYSITGHTGGIRAMIGWERFIITGSDDTSIKVSIYVLVLKRFGMFQQEVV